MATSNKGAGDMPPVTITPFADEAASISVGGLTIENRLDRISLYGSLDITRDRQGLEDARRLLALLKSVVRALEGDGDQLPDEGEGEPEATRVPNPFA
jgi:hypothetical protein